MKKKLLTIALAVMLALGCFVGLIACGSKVDGTYYMYESGNKIDGVAMVLEGGKVSMKTEIMGVVSTTEVGTYEVKGDKILMTASIEGASETQEVEIVSSGVLKVGPGMYYCLDGKTPPTEETEEE